MPRFNISKASFALKCQPCDINLFSNSSAFNGGKQASPGTELACYKCGGASGNLIGRFHCGHCRGKEKMKCNVSGCGSTQHASDVSRLAMRL